MALTPEQQTVIAAAIAADQALAAWAVERRDDLIADAFNAPSSPAFKVWRTSVGKDEITQNGFDWTRLDNLSVGKARVWDAMFDNATRSMNPAKSNVRAGIESVWVGTAADLAVRAAVYVHCKRVVSRAEKLFATGTGTDAVPGIADATFNGTVSTSDISAILNAG